MNVRSCVRKSRFVALVGLVLLGSDAAARAESIAAEFAGDYSFLDLGKPDGVPGKLGGLTFLAGDPNTLLIGGNANNPGGAIYSVGVARDGGGHITGFSGSATLFATAPEIDGGLAYGPGGVLFYTGYNENLLGQIKPGSTSPDKIVELGPLGIVRSVGALSFVPEGFPGAGGLWLASYNSSRFYTASLTPDGSGTFDVGDVAFAATIPGGPEGFIYVPPGSPGFNGPSMLVSEYGAGRVSAYNLDVDGVPILATRRDFFIDLIGTEGALIDPISGDFLFSTFAPEQRVLVVRGFAAPPAPAAVPEPSTLLMAGLALIGAATSGGGRRRVVRRRKKAE